MRILDIPLEGLLDEDRVFTPDVASRFKARLTGFAGVVFELLILLFLKFSSRSKLFSVDLDLDLVNREDLSKDVIVLSALGVVQSSCDKILSSFTGVENSFFLH